MAKISFVLVRSGRKVARGRNLSFITSNEGRAICCSDPPGGNWQPGNLERHHPRRSVGCQLPCTAGRIFRPLHLLLALLEKKQLDISEVNLVEITSSYWMALKEVGQFNPGSMCDFVDVATRLMALKARFLRPSEEQAPELDPEDEDDLSLMEQLAQLKRFMAPMEELLQREQAALHTYRRQVPLSALHSEITGPMENSALVLRALRRIATQLPRVKPVTVIPKPLFPIEGQIGKVRDALRRWRLRTAHAPMSFFSLFSARSHKAEVISTFMAVLELVRRRNVVARQERPFGDIELQPLDD